MVPMKMKISVFLLFGIFLFSCSNSEKNQFDDTPIKGEIAIDGIVYTAGEVAMAKALQEITIQSNKAAVVFKSYVP